MTRVIQSTAEGCILCGGQSERCFYAQDALGTTKRRFALLRCQHCGLHRLSPSQSIQETADLYPSDYEPFRASLDPQPNAWQRWLCRRHWRLRCRAVRRYRAGGRLLDVGCGTGEFLAALRQNDNWQVVGVEMNERAATHARYKLGLNVHLGDLSMLDLPIQTLDIVTMWEVLEHLPEPLRGLQTVARLLKPDGVLLLSTPNAQAWQARLWGKWWYGWDIPRHLYVFTPPALHRLLTRAGFHVVQRLHFPADRFFLVESWLRRLDSAPRPRSRTLRGWTRHLTAAVAVMLWPVLRLLDLTDCGSQITVAASPASHLYPAPRHLDNHPQEREG